MANFRSRRSMSEPSLHMSGHEESSCLLPLTLRDLEEAGNKSVDKNNLQNMESFESASDYQLFMKKKQSEDRAHTASAYSPEINKRNSGSVRYSSDDLLSDLRQCHSANSYRILKDPSITSHTQLFSSPSRASAPVGNAVDYVTSQIEDWDSEEFVKLSADNLLSPSLEEGHFSEREMFRQNSLSDSILSEHSKEIFHQNWTRPASARSNCTSVTILNEDVERERLRVLQDVNIHLNNLVSSLRNQLESKQSVQEQQYEIMKERMISLKEETAANEKSLRNAEEALEKAHMLCEEKTSCITSLKSELDRLSQQVADVEFSRQSASKNYEEACRDASHLAQQLEQVQTTAHSSRKAYEEKGEAYLNEIEFLQSEKVKSSNLIEKLELTNLELQADLRAAVQEVKLNEVAIAEQKAAFQNQVDELKARFASLKEDLEMKTEELKVTKGRHKSLEEELRTAQESNTVYQDRLQSCQLELEELTKVTHELEEKLALKQTNEDVAASSDPVNGVETAFDENCACDAKSPRKLKAFIAELKMKLSSKDAQIERLEAHISTYSAEAEKLDSIRGDLINFVERSKTGDRRVSQLEGIVLQLEEERSKVTRRVMECEDELSDKRAQHESLEARLSERTYAMKKMQNECNETKKALEKLHEDIDISSKRIKELERDLDCKSQECERHMKEIGRLTDDVESKEKALEHAAEWTGKKEAENKREIAKMKKINTEQHESMEKEIERLQEICTRYKDQTNDMECTLCQLQQENVGLVRQLDTKQNELQVFMEEHMTLKKESEETLKNLLTNAGESAGQVQHLQTTLERYKVEISDHVNQLQSANERFNHDMSIKDQKVSQLEANLNVANESLKSKHEHVQSLEKILREKETWLKEMSEKMLELQDCNSCMKSKISKLEKHLGEVTRKAAQEKQYYDERVQSALSELTAKKHQFSKLNEALRQVEKEFNGCRDELTSVEHQVRILEAESSEKEKEMREAQDGERKAAAALEDSKAKALRLERLLQDANEKMTAIHEKCGMKESDLLRTQAEIKSFAIEIEQLKSSLQSANTDIEKKDMALSRLQTALRDTRSNLLAKESDVEELERALEDRQWELAQRAAQLGKLETTVKEHRSVTEKRNIELQAEVRKTKIELKERNVQLGNLDEQLSDLRREIAEKQHQLEEKEQEARHRTEELKNKAEQLLNFEKALQESRTTYAECHRNLLEVNQELRVSREKAQNSTQQFSLAQGSIDAMKREYECLVDDLRELKSSEKEKDAYAMELLAKNVALETEKNSLERTYTAELENLRNDVLKMHQQHRDEVMHLRNELVKRTENAKMSASTRADELQNALECEKEMKRECQTLRSAVESLRKEAMARKQVLEVANDTIVLKEAEIARLVAKYASLERGLQMMRETSPDERNSGGNSVLPTDDIIVAPRFSSTGKNAKQSPSYDIDSLSELFPDSSLQLHE